MTDTKDPFIDYFSTEEHVAIFGEAFADLFQGASNTVTKEIGDDVNRTPGLLRAISRIQGAAAAAAHFYSTAQMNTQGAEYFRGLADQIEKSNPPASQATAKKPRRK